MTEAFLLLLLAQWHSTTNAQMVVTPPSCYYNANKTLETVFFPCGDPQNGFKSCCQEGDICLADNACFNPAHGTTYLAGCTDEEYADSSCPIKPNLEDHQWVGLITCNGVSTNWFACGDNGPTITSGMGCNCPQTSATLAFLAAADPIPNIMQLGLSYGISSCYQGYSIYCAEATEGPFPSLSSTAAPSSAATSASTPVRTSSEFLTTNSGGQLITVFITTIAPTSSSIISPASESPIGSLDSLRPPTTSSAASVGVTSSPNPPIPSGPGLQSRAEVGIGIGSAVGAVLVGALLWYCISCLRKRHKKKSASSTNDKTGPSSSDETTGFAENMQLGDDDPRSPTWSGHKSELPAENKDPRSPTWSGHKSELPADDHEVRSPVPPYAPLRGSCGSTQISETEGILGHGGHGKGLRDGLYEMP